MPFRFGYVYGVVGHNDHKRVTCRPSDIIWIRFENRVYSCVVTMTVRGVNAKLLDDIVCKMKENFLCGF